MFVILHVYRPEIFALILVVTNQNCRPRCKPVTGILSLFVPLVSLSVLLPWGDFSNNGASGDQGYV